MADAKAVKGDLGDLGPWYPKAGGLVADGVRIPDRVHASTGIDVIARCTTVFWRAVTLTFAPPLTKWCRSSAH